MDDKSNIGQNNSIPNIGNGNDSNINTNQTNLSSNNNSNNNGVVNTNDDLFDSLDLGIQRINSMNQNPPLQSATNNIHIPSDSSQPGASLGNDPNHTTSSGNQNQGQTTVGQTYGNMNIPPANNVQNSNSKQPPISSISGGSVASVDPGIGSGFMTGQMQQSTQQTSSTSDMYGGGGNASPEVPSLGDFNNESIANIEKQSEVGEKNVEDLQKIEEVSGQIRKHKTQKIKKEQVADGAKDDLTNNKPIPSKFDKIFGYPVPENIVKGEVNSTDPHEVTTWLSFFVKRLEEMWAK